MDNVKKNIAKKKWFEFYFNDYKIFKDLIGNIFIYCNNLSFSDIRISTDKVLYYNHNILNDYLIMFGGNIEEFEELIQNEFSTKYNVNIKKVVKIELNDSITLLMLMDNKTF